MHFIICLLVLTTTPVRAQSIIGLGIEWSAATGVSADGSVAVGYANAQAFRWVRGVGMQSLGFLPNTDSSFARGVSADGSVVVGGAYNATEGHAFRWTSTGGMASLGGFVGATYSDATRVSADGSVVVGGSGDFAFRWSAGSGLQNLGLLSGATSTYALDVNADGSVIVGDSGDRAFRWISGSGMQSLHGDIGQTVSAAYAVNGDGSVVAGEAGESWQNRGQTFRWTSGGEVQLLGKLPGDTYSFPNAISADGLIIVGQSLLVLSETSNQSRAFVWQAGSGMVEMGAYLATAGLDTAGWNFTEAFDISADGRTIVGRGTFNGTSQAFVAQVPEPSALSLLAVGLGGLALLRQSRKKD